MWFSHLILHPDLRHLKPSKKYSMKKTEANVVMSHASVFVESIPNDEPFQALTLGHTHFNICQVFFLLRTLYMITTFRAIPD